MHQAPKKTNGSIVIDSGVASFTDADGDGNVTAIVTGVSPTLLQAILDKPRDYYVNLHTSVNPGGAMRDQLETSKKKQARRLSSFQGEGGMGPGVPGPMLVRL